MGGYIESYKISPPDEVLSKNEFDYVVFATVPGYDDCLKKCIHYGIGKEQIIDRYVILPLESRRQFLEDLAYMLNSHRVDGAVAEAGVFEGDFAKYMNRYFKGKELYLFDTFQGFDERDIAVENELGVSRANAGDYDNTSIQLVLSKMDYPDRVHIVEGYFPESATTIEEHFCFANLDMDLYAPTLNGLEWFTPRMVPGAVLLVHDYFGDVFLGVRSAVDEFISGHGNYRLYPIGDGKSVMIAGF